MSCKRCTISSRVESSRDEIFHVNVYTSSCTKHCALLVLYIQFKLHSSYIRESAPTYLHTWLSPFCFMFFSRILDFFLLILSLTSDLADIEAAAPDELFNRHPIRRALDRFYVGRLLLTLYRHIKNVCKNNNEICEEILNSNIYKQRHIRNPLELHCRLAKKFAKNRENSWMTIFGKSDNFT